MCVRIIGAPATSTSSERKFRCARLMMPSASGSGVGTVAAGTLDGEWTVGAGVEGVVVGVDATPAVACSAAVGASALVVGRLDVLASQFAISMMSTTRQAMVCHRYVCCIGTLTPPGSVR